MGILTASKKVWVCSKADCPFDIEGYLCKVIKRLGLIEPRLCVQIDHLLLTTETMVSSNEAIILVWI